MKRQFKFDQDGKTTDFLGFAGTIKQIFVNSYLTEGLMNTAVVYKERRITGKLTNTKVDLKVGGLDILQDYYGSPTDVFNLLTEEFEISEGTMIEMDIDGERTIPTDPELVNPVILTVVYEPSPNQKRVNLKG